MELKTYQVNTLDAFTRWLQVLEKSRIDTEGLASVIKQQGLTGYDDMLNYPKKAWEDLAGSGGVAETAGEYVSRTDDAGRPIPHVCFKVPTGGGKTLLAAAALQRLGRQSGLVLWIVPTRAIYDQTRKALWNREHPYRQMLERASGGRVKVLEKDDPFTREDVANYLCVMLIMYSAASREKSPDFLRMFRDSGRLPSFFPYSDDLPGQDKLLNDYSDLDRLCVNEKCPAKQEAKSECNCGKEWKTGPVKQSLFNVFKITRPVVVLDEAHKAYGKQVEGTREFVRKVNRLDPSLVIELSATPNSGISNLLVDIGGTELQQEEMIKLPVEVRSYTSGDWSSGPVHAVDWQFTLERAKERLDELASEAESLKRSGGRYIRPIAVVRVERTGKDQRDGERVHAEDVRDWLTRNPGVPREQVRVKSSDLDELGKEDLLSAYSPVRWIITKSALMEGWDCPFAYVLVMLDNTQAQNALTQLVGRVMRQPYARRTGRQALDQCYVHCMNTDVGVAVQQVKNGLESEGLTGLGDQVAAAGGEGPENVIIERREKFRGQDIFLPMVLHRSGEGWVELDYQRHILSGVEWGGIGAPDVQAFLDAQLVEQGASVYVGKTPTAWHTEQELQIDKTVEVSWFARRLSGVVPNPWQAARIAEEALRKMREAKKTDDSIFDQRSSLSHRLTRHVSEEVEKQAEEVFRSKLKRGDIKFDLKSSGKRFEMKETYSITLPEDSGLLARRNGQQLEFNLFEPAYNNQYNNLERNFARYLDEQKAIRWWHRVAARQRNDYYLRGWKQDRIWPDFVGMADWQDGKPHVLVFETKGGHLDNPDTAYKRKVLETLENAFNCGTMTIREGPARGTFRIVFSEDEFPAALSNLKEAYAPRTG